MGILNILSGKKEDGPVKQPGALIDERPLKEREKDIQFSEIVAAANPVIWKQKTHSEVRRFPIFDQGTSGSCVAQTGKKMIGVYAYLKTGSFFPVSASHIYKRRSNRPYAGMNANDVFAIMSKGVTPAVFARDEKMSDTEMDSVEITPFAENAGTAFKTGEQINLHTGNIDEVASVIQSTGKAVMVWFYFTVDEWTSRPKVTNDNLELRGEKTSRHSVAAVDFTLTSDGKRALVIDDSWGPTAGNGAGQRIVDEDFFRARNFYSGHFMNFSFENGENKKPSYRFDRDLEFKAIVTYDRDVVALQDCLKFEGLFPFNTESTGYYGIVTKRAVGSFQAKYDIARVGDAGYGRVGPKTRAKLNQIYS